MAVRLVRAQSSATVAQILARITPQKANEPEPLRLHDVDRFVTQQPFECNTADATRDVDAAADCDCRDVLEKERTKPPRITRDDDGRADGGERESLIACSPLSAPRSPSFVLQSALMRKSILLASLELLFNEITKK